MENSTDTEKSKVQLTTAIAILSKSITPCIAEEASTFWTNAKILEAVAQISGASFDKIQIQTQLEIFGFVKDYIADLGLIWWVKEN